MTIANKEGHNNAKELLEHISLAVGRLARLYQIPNWNDIASVDLAEWIIENYKYDRLEVIERCLRNPPATEERNFRLTPDTITRWMKDTLEKEADSRERQFSKMKDKYISEAAEQYKAIDWKPSVIDTNKMVNNFLERLKPEPKRLEISIDDFQSRKKYPKSLAKEYLEQKKKSETKQ